MMFVRLTAGRLAFALLLLAPAAAWASEPFPFGQELMLDSAPMGRVKRVPMLVVEPNGDATIRLWCKDAPARVEVAESAIRIEPGPLPDGLPAMMTEGQCSGERMQADIDTLAALAAATGWHRKGDRLLLDGPMPLKFFVSSH